MGWNNPSETHWFSSIYRGPVSLNSYPEPSKQFEPLFNNLLTGKNEWNFNGDQKVHVRFLISQVFFGDMEGAKVVMLMMMVVMMLMTFHYLYS